MKLSILVAIAENNVIGNDNKLIWHLPADLKFFKNLTTGHSIIMGRKTFDSIGRPLPNRRNIVITRQKDFRAAGTEVCHSVEEAVQLVKNEDEAFIIGGAEIYKLSHHFCSKLIITRVHHSFEGDTFFPETDFSQWKKVFFEPHKKDEKNLYDYTFEIYERV